MNNDELLSKIKNYEERIFYLENELNQTKEHLKKYTAPSNMIPTLDIQRYKI